MEGRWGLWWKPRGIRKEVIFPCEGVRDKGNITGEMVIE